MELPCTIRVVAAFAAVSLLCQTQAYAFDPPKVGKPVPDFNYTDAKGKPHRLSEHKGRYVVLEWTNQVCPFVIKHYDSGNMQALQKEVTSQGGIWLTVISSAPGKPGYVTAEQQSKYLAEKKASPSDVLLDPLGLLGRRYGVITTPHVFVLDEHGVVIYSGAIDDTPTAAQADIKRAKNYVRTALQSAKAGKPVTPSTTMPYGCPVQYKD